MDIVKELQVLREELIREIDEKIEQMIKKLPCENRPVANKGYSPII